MPDKEPFHYEGFVSPNTTPVPDDVFDIIAPELTEAELRVLLYVIRRTFGFKKNSDSISASQMVNGIKTRDGRILDRGTGMAKSAVWRGIQGLVTKGILQKASAISEHGDNEVNIYSLRFRDEGVVLKKDHGSPAKEPPVVLKENTQETVVQQTVKQNTERDNSNIRKVQTEKNEYDEARLTLLEYISDLALEFVDTASVRASTSRAVNLYARAGLTLDDFINAMIDARAITKERTGSIKNRTNDGDKSKMAYFFSVLEDRLGLKSV